jgi:hypothetical protein
MALICGIRSIEIHTNNNGKPIAEVLFYFYFFTDSRLKKKLESEESLEAQNIKSETI